MNNKAKYDVMFIGPACVDENIDYTGVCINEPGGAVLFGVAASRAAGARTCAALKISPEDCDILSGYPLPKEDIFVIPSENTTRMRNEYFTADRERRNSQCLVSADAITSEQIPSVSCSLYHLAGLVYGDFPVELIPYLAERAKLSADVQGFLRHNDDGKLHFKDWECKQTHLKYFDFLKADAAEAEILTGSPDRYDAAKILIDMGAKEVLISYNTEMLVFDGKDYYTYPVKSRNLSGRTGRGDTVFGAYIAKRITGFDIESSLLFATATVSLKMETPGPILHANEYIQDYIENTYKKL